MIENLQTKLLAERRRNVVQEMEIRKEMGDMMLQLIMESEELRRWVLGLVDNSRRHFIHPLCSLNPGHPVGR